MGKYGKVNKINRNIGHYSIGLLGESGIGKTTLMVNVCHKLFGDDGYMILNMGKEQGVDAIDGAVYEDVPTWHDFDAITKDIIRNKDEDYPDLQVLVLDTIDQMIEIATKQTIEDYNRENAQKQGFTPAKTLNASWGGFGAGNDYCTNMILNKMWELKKVGVSVWIVGHVKLKDNVDAITGNTYITLTTDIQQKMFNAFKNKMHVIGIGYIDRTIEKRETDQVNIVTRKNVERNVVESERRMISFRDDEYGIDSKSRFANIVPNIPFDSDAFIKAIQDAIDASVKDKSNTKTEPEKATRSHVFVQSDVDKDKQDESEQDNPDEDIELESEPMNEPEPDDNNYYPEDLVKAIKTVFRNSTPEQKQEIKKMLNGKKLADSDNETLMAIYDKFGR